MDSIGQHGDTLFGSHLREWRYGLLAWRALVLQCAHPVVAVGVAQHSTFRAHPWRRIEHTMSSTARLAWSDPETLRREIARLNRSHKRISGVDAKGEPYSALDPATRAWVLVTLYESAVTMRALGGDPMTAAEQDRMYTEFRAMAAAFELPEEVLPATAADVPAYYDTVIAQQLEDSEPMRHMLYRMLHEAPVPTRLRLLGPAWIPVRALVARFVTATTIADLPPAFREKFGIARTRRHVLASLFTHRVLGATMARLPARYRYQPAPTSRTLEPVRPDEHGTGLRALLLRQRDARKPKLSQFFQQVLDQTGDGFIDDHDLQAMAHNVCWQLELSEEREAQVRAAFTRWWHHMAASMDADGDGRISCAEFVAATIDGCDNDPSYLDKGLHEAMRAVFRAADADGSGTLEIDEYRAVFGSRIHPAELWHGFRQLDGDGDGTLTEEEFLTGFTEFFTARSRLAAGSHLLGKP